VIYQIKDDGLTRGFKVYGWPWTAGRKPWTPVRSTRH